MKTLSFFELSLYMTVAAAATAAAVLCSLLKPSFGGKARIHFIRDAFTILREVLALNFQPCDMFAMFIQQTQVDCILGP
jgi:hypothetical protein